jgi:putative phosphoribosyl transferase
VTGAANIRTAERQIEIPPAGIAADLRIPENAQGLIIFAHGSGSSRLSPRNRFVAGLLQRDGFGTLLLDLLTASEEEADLQTRRLRFDIELLARRLVEATRWVQQQSPISALPVGYFGASTGAAAALIAAAELRDVIGAVASRGGRPDLAGAALLRVKAPTLLIVGGADWPVIDLNQTALEQLRCQKCLEIVPGATHLFQEPGALQRVSELASGWFRDHLRQRFPQAPQ